MANATWGRDDNLTILGDRLLTGFVAFFVPVRCANVSTGEKQCDSYVGSDGMIGASLSS
jgi:hypothetical protein